MTTTTGQAEATQPLSARLRDLSRDDHRRAETASVLRELFAGRLDRSEYAAMVGQLLLVYSALEDVSVSLRDDPVAGGFVSKALFRRDALAADLAVLAGDVTRPAPLPATAAYCARIRATEAWPGGFVAHHYTRYLGDLSGGPMIGRAAASAFDLRPDAGLAFYQFPGIADPDVFKQEYRARLDQAPWSEREQRRIGDEVLVAYAHNVDLLHALHGDPA